MTSVLSEACWKMPLSMNWKMLLFSSLTPTAIDYNPNVSATMQQPSSVEHANYKTDNL